MMHRNARKAWVPLAALAAAVMLTSCGSTCTYSDSCCAATCSTSCCNTALTPNGMPTPPAQSPAPVTPPAAPPQTTEVKPDSTKVAPLPVEKIEKIDKVEEVKPIPKAPDVKADARKAVRIRAGSAVNWTDKEGNSWLADAGFSEGAMVDMGHAKIEGTNNPDIYASEHSNMEKFTWQVPNGKYAVKLHFVENPEDVKKAGERVFSIDVLGEKIKSLDILKEAGAANKALIKTVHVTVTNGQIDIGFKPEMKEPLINGIEIIPE